MSQVGSLHVPGASGTMVSMSDEERVEALLEAYDCGDPWFMIDQLVDSDPPALRDLAWELLKQLKAARAKEREGMINPDVRLH